MRCDPYGTENLVIGSIGMDGIELRNMPNEIPDGEEYFVASSLKMIAWFALESFV